MGRFISPDPIGYAGGLNLYGYCGNDPVNAVDPSGLYWEHFNWNDFRREFDWNQYRQDVGGVFRGYGKAAWSFAYGMTTLGRAESAAGLVQLGLYAQECGIGAALSLAWGGLVSQYTDWLSTSDPERFGESFGTVLITTATIAAPYARGGGCFAAGTLIAMADGTVRAIEEVKAGDPVRTADPETGKQRQGKVVRTFVAEADRLILVETADGARLRATEGHPFFVESRGFVEARKLARGDLLRRADGRSVRVVGLGWEERRARVYNLEVEGTHTYFAAGLWVHNACPDVPIHSKFTRFWVRADELLDDNNVKRLHPIFPEQLHGSELVGHGGVANLSNADLLRFGGPRGDDPISGFRRFGSPDEVGPGSIIHIRGGHHRLYEIAERVRGGRMSGKTLIEFLVNEDP